MLLALTCQTNWSWSAFHSLNVMVGCLINVRLELPVGQRKSSWPVTFFMNHSPFAPPFSLAVHMRSVTHNLKYVRFCSRLARIAAVSKIVHPCLMSHANVEKTIRANVVMVASCTSLLVMWQCEFYNCIALLNRIISICIEFSVTTIDLPHQYHSSMTTRLKMPENWLLDFHFCLNIVQKHWV